MNIDKSKTIAIISHLDPSLNNGPSQHLKGIIEGFHRNGVDVEVFASGLYEFSSSKYIKFYHLADSQPKGIFDIIKWHINLFVRLIQNRKKYSWVYVRSGSFMLSPLYSLLVQAQLALEVNGVPHIELRRSWILRTIAKKMFVWQLNHSKIVFTVTTGLKKYLSSLSSCEIFVVSNGISDSMAAEISPSEEIPETKYTRVEAIFVGALHDWQGVDLAIEGIKMARSSGIDIILKIIGDGPELKKLKALSQELDSTPYVIFYGHLDKKEVIEELRKSHIALAPFKMTKRNEIVGGLSPIKIYEYLAFNIPVITTDLVDDPELIFNLKNSIFISNQNAGDICAAIINAINTRRQNSSAWIAANRTWHSAATSTLSRMSINERK